MNKIIAKGEYIANLAKKFYKVGYYQSNEFTQKNTEYMNKEKERLKTKRKTTVTSKINDILKDVQDEKYKNKVFNILKKIYNKNQEKAFNPNGDEIINGDLLNLLADKSLLLLSYAKVRKNAGAMAEAAEMENKNYEKLNAEEKSWVNRTTNNPDGLTKKIFELTSKLIKENKYPWGASRRIYVDKSGKKNAKIPITIPFFMDKVVQEALTTILMVIYEPYFEAQNCSFGFRPNRGVDDAIISLTSHNSIGLNKALEGDIKSAYDKVNRQKLIEILGKRIKDNKLLNFIKTRLNYDYFDTEENKYVQLKEGLQQEGLDSPYLWNIYMSPFDEFIVQYLYKELEETNSNTRGQFSKQKKMLPQKEKRSIDRKITTLRKIREWIKNNSKEITIIQKTLTKTAKELKKQSILTGELLGYTKIIKEIGIGKIKDIRQIIKNINQLEKKWKEQGNNFSSIEPNTIQWRFIYVRYADYWIILTNTKNYMFERIKEKIINFLSEELNAKLSIEKTLITDITETPAHFIGFEISTYKNKKIRGKNIKIRTVVAGNKVFALPDRQRLIERLYFNGYCDKKGFPREIGYLINLDDFSIIERFNAVLMGLALYYCEFIKNPKRNLSRLFYIIRYSCFKTIAQKHKSTIRRVFKDYVAPRAIDITSKEHTIQVEMKNKISDKTYKKTCRLHTQETLIKKALSLGRKKKLYDIYWKLNKQNPVEYADEEKHRITNDNFYEKINWINIKT
jgi:hypothetical protein